MIAAISYQEMLRKIREDIRHKGVLYDYVGVLFTRPSLATGQDIINDLEYYHHLTGNEFNFYLPGYSGYGGEHFIKNVNDTPWYFNNKEFAKFVKDFERNTRWTYEGESELLLFEVHESLPDYSKVMRFYLDKMLRDKTIESVPNFMQKLIRLCRDTDALNKISNSYGVDQLWQHSKKEFLKRLPGGLGKVFLEEKYFCINNMAL